MSKLRTQLLLAMIAAGAAMVVGPVMKANADSYNDMFNAVDWLAHKYGVTVYTDQQPMEYGTYAVTSGDVITFNSGYTANPALLRRDVSSDVWSGYHHAAKCTPEQYVAAHEFGHVLDNLTGSTADTELQTALANGLTGTVSGYAVTNIREALAESFAAVECDTPTPVERTLYTMLTT